jgi:hypothetical protein
MRSATSRRFALVAAMVLLAPIWCRPAVITTARQAPGTVLLALTPADHGATPAVRRQISGGWRMAGTRSDFGRGLVLLGVAALLALVRPAPAARVAAARVAPPLARRRHAIALRAPPLPSFASQ